MPICTTQLTNYKDQTLATRIFFEYSQEES